MAYPPSSYGERPPLQGFRRSFTAPHRQLSLHERAGLDNTDADAGILFTHPYVRIISFAPPPESIKSKTTQTDRDADYPIDTVETLPWRSRTENLITSGPLIIEKVRGSVPCFKRGDDFVHPIVRNSQCWCVDHESKFVLRKGKLQYYRFELPNATQEDQKKVEEFKTVLAKELKYERTPCPFIRAYQVELPDDAITPRRKGKWKRREESLPSTPESGTPGLRRSKMGRSLSMQIGSSAASDLPSARRGSDYGFVQTPRHSSLRTSYLADRPATPSSMASDEEYGRHSIQEQDSDEEFRTEDGQEDIVEEPEESIHAAAATSVPSENGKLISGDTEIGGLEHSHTNKKDELPITITQHQPSITVEDHEAINASLLSKKYLKRDVNPTLETTANTQPNVAPDSPALKPDEQPKVEETPVVSSVSISSNIAEAVPIDEDAGQLVVEQSFSNGHTAAHEPFAGDEEAELRYPAEPQEDYQRKLLDPAQVQGPVAGLEEDNRQTLADQSPVPSSVEGLFDSDEHVHDAVADEDDLLNISDIPEGTFLPSTPELHYLEEHANLLEEHGFSDEELEPLAAASSPISLPYIQRHFNPDQIFSVDVQDDAASVASTADSFFTVDQAGADQDPAPRPGVDADATPLAEPRDPFGFKNRQHRRDISEITITASTFSGSPEMPNVELFVTSEDAPRPGTPRLVVSSASDESWPDPATPSDIQEGLRRRLKSHRSLSPLPPSRNVFTGGSQHQGNHLTSAILQKACNVALVKPIEVVVLLVHVLARIAGGATVNDLMSGDLFKKPHARQNSSSFPEQVGRPTQEEDEDDYGVPIRGRAKSQDDPPAVSTKEKDVDADSIFDLD